MSQIKLIRIGDEGLERTEYECRSWDRNLGEDDDRLSLCSGNIVVAERWSIIWGFQFSVVEGLWLKPLPLEDWVFFGQKKKRRLGFGDGRSGL